MKVNNGNQFEMLVAELEKAPKLARGFQRGVTSSNFKETWESLASRLNAIGPPNRDSNGWQKVWRDLKFKVKKKMVHNKAEASATGGGHNKQMSLCPIEEAVASILNFDRIVNPSGRFASIEAPQTNADSSPVFESILNENSSAAPEQPLSNDSCTSSDAIETSSRTPRRNYKRGKENLLQKHHEMQEDVFKKRSSTFESMKNHLKDFARYEKKQYELSQRKAEREEELFQIELQIKKKKLELLEKQLQ